MSNKDINDTKSYNQNQLHQFLYKQSYKKYISILLLSTCIYSYTTPFTFELGTSGQPGYNDPSQNVTQLDQIYKNHKTDLDGKVFMLHDGAYKHLDVQINSPIGHFNRLTNGKTPEENSKDAFQWISNNMHFNVVKILQPTYYLFNINSGQWPRQVATKDVQFKIGDKLIDETKLIYNYYSLPNSAYAIQNGYNHYVEFELLKNKQFIYFNNEKLIYSTYHNHAGYYKKSYGSSYEEDEIRTSHVQFSPFNNDNNPNIFIYSANKFNLHILKLSDENQNYRSIFFDRHPEAKLYPIHNYHFSNKNIPTIQYTKSSRFTVSANLLQENLHLPNTVYKNLFSSHPYGGKAIIILPNLIQKNTSSKARHYMAILKSKSASDIERTVQLLENYLPGENEKILQITDSSITATTEWQNYVKYAEPYIKKQKRVKEIRDMLGSGSDDDLINFFDTWNDQFQQQFGMQNNLLLSQAAIEKKMEENIQKLTDEMDAAEKTVQVKSTELLNQFKTNANKTASDLQNNPDIEKAKEEADKSANDALGKLATFLSTKINNIKTDKDNGIKLIQDKSKEIVESVEKEFQNSLDTLKKQTTDTNAQREKLLQELVNNLDQQYQETLNSAKTKNDTIKKQTIALHDKSMMELQEINAKFQLDAQGHLLNIEKTEKELIKNLQENEATNTQEINDMSKRIANKINEIEQKTNQLSKASEAQKEQLSKQLDANKEEFDKLMNERQQVIDNAIKTHEQNIQKTQQEQKNKLATIQSTLSEYVNTTLESTKKRITASTDDIKKQTTNAIDDLQQFSEQRLNESKEFIKQQQQQVVKEISKATNTAQQDVEQVLNGLATKNNLSQTGASTTNKIEHASNNQSNVTIQAIQNNANTAMNNIDNRLSNMLMAQAGDLILDSSFWSKISGGYIRHQEYINNDNNNISDPAHHWFISGSIGYDYALTKDVNIGLAGHIGYSQYKEDYVHLDTPVDENKIITGGISLYGLWNFHKKLYYNNITTFMIGQNHEHDARADNNEKNISFADNKAISEAKFISSTLNLYNGIGGTIFSYNIPDTIQQFNINCQAGIQNNFYFTPEYKHILSEKTKTDELDIKFNRRWSMDTKLTGKISFSHNTLYDNDYLTAHDIYFKTNVLIPNLSYLPPIKYRFLLLDQELRSSIKYGRNYDLNVGYRLILQNKKAWRISGDIAFTTRPGEYMGCIASIKFKLNV